MLQKKCVRTILWVKMPKIIKMLHNCRNDWKHLIICADHLILLLLLFTVKTVFFFFHEILFLPWNLFSNYIHLIHNLFLTNKMCWMNCRSAKISIPSLLSWKWAAILENGETRVQWIQFKRRKFLVVIIIFLYT